MQTMVKNKMKKNKGQVKIQQMAFMLIAVTLFFVLVGIFVLGVKFSGLKKTATMLEEKNAILLVSKLANSPEFSCGGAFSGKINCIDADKVMILRENIQKYDGFWGVSNIEIKKIYPSESSEIICNMGNYPDCNTIRLIQGDVIGTSVSNFVSLCRKESLEGEGYDKCEVAKVMISYEKK